MIARVVLCAALAFACGGDITSGAFDVTQPRAPKRVAAPDPLGSVSKPNAEDAPRSVGPMAAIAVASSDAGAPRELPRASADAGASSSSEAGASDAGHASSDAAALAPLDVACKRDSDCASGWCRPLFEICGDPTTLPLASGLLCASDAECRSGHCDPLYYDPAHQVSHNCR